MWKSFLQQDLRHMELLAECCFLRRKSWNSKTVSVIKKRRAASTLDFLGCIPKRRAAPRRSVRLFSATTARATFSFFINLLTHSMTIRFQSSSHHAIFTKQFFRKVAYSFRTFWHTCFHYIFFMLTGKQPPVNTNSQALLVTNAHAPTHTHTQYSRTRAARGAK